MIIGIDIGNFNTKSSKGVIFESKVSKVGSLLGSKYNLVLNDEEYKIGEGNFDTEFRKINKENYLKLLFGSLALSDVGNEVQLVLGLPISQYKADREELIEKVEEHYHLQGSLNNKQYNVYITNVDVYPEGIASVEDNFKGIVVDIGGRTTDCTLLSVKNNKRIIEHPVSIPIGTLNLYSDFINAINGKYSLDLKIDDTERLLKGGLKIKGEKRDIKFGKDIFIDFIKDLISKLRVEYSLDTYDICFTGGGSILLEGIIRSLLPYSHVKSDGLMSNANGFKKYGESLWL
ncbi:ParM/StbA family protein [Clostridium nigeriense]|uniref:ParM/StbA family protein n=1 Tax=Clostridium nigeriense TaxID=1805470 RepID=UPI00082D17C2|nr:ParM/StbA family protein [Clostridium nigeriense]